MNEVNWLFSDFPAKVAEEVARAKTTRVLKRGDFLYRAGETATGIYYVRRGLVGLIVATASGNEHLVRLFKSGQHLGHRSLFAREPFHASAIALEETEIIGIPRATVIHLVEGSPQFALKMLETLARELKRAEMRGVSLSEKDVTARVAEAVLYLQEIHPNHQWTRREIAEFCGSTTPTVIRTLARFEQDGVIAQSGRKIEVRDRQRLVDLAAVDS